jgi:hypothetical protein
MMDQSPFSPGSRYRVSADVTSAGGEVDLLHVGAGSGSDVASLIRRVRDNGGLFTGEGRTVIFTPIGQIYRLTIVEDDRPEEARP